MKQNFKSMLFITFVFIGLVFPYNTYGMNFNDYSIVEENYSISYKSEKISNLKSLKLSSNLLNEKYFLSGYVKDLKYSSRNTLFYSTVSLDENKSLSKIENTFNTGNKDLGSDNITYSILDSDGNILAFGNSQCESSPCATMWKFNSDGTLNQNFGSGGYKNIKNSNNRMTSLLSGTNIGGDYPNVIAGSILKTNYINDLSILLIKSNNNGDLDPNFGEKGLLEIDEPMGTATNYEQAKYVLSDSEYIYIVGYARNSTKDSYKVFLLKRNFDGSAIKEFGEEGYILIENSKDISQDLAILQSFTKNGFIYVIVNEEDKDGKDTISIYKFDNNGKKLEDFGVNSRKELIVEKDKVLLTNYTSIVEFKEGLFVGGKIVSSDNSERAVIAYFDFEGNLNKTFNDSGLYYIDTYKGGKVDTVKSLKQLNNNSVGCILTVQDNNSDFFCVPYI